MMKEGQGGRRKGEKKSHQENGHACSRILRQYDEDPGFQINLHI